MQDIWVIISWPDRFLQLGHHSPIWLICRLFFYPIQWIPYPLMVLQIFERKSINWRTSCLLVYFHCLANSVCSFFSFFVKSDWNVLFRRHLYDNQLTGGLPASWSALSNLRQMYFFFFPLAPLFQVLNQSQRVLHSNQLSGPIPATWFPVPPAFPNLQHLCVSVFFCFFFTFFWLSIERSLFTNQLSGPLPSSWSALSNLQYLYVLFASPLSNILVFNASNFQIFGRQSIHWRTSCYLVCSHCLASSVCFCFFFFYQIWLKCPFSQTFVR